MKEECFNPRPLRLLYVERWWFARRTLEYLLREEPCEWTFAGNDYEVRELIAKTPEGFDLVIVDHERSEGWGLHVVQMLRQAGYTGAMLAIAIDGILPVERLVYETYHVPVLLLSPANPAELRMAVIEAVACR